MKKNRKPKKYLKLLLIILIVLTLGIGYAILTQKLIIGGNLIYGTIKWDVGYKVATDGGGTVSSNPSISNDKKTITENASECGFLSSRVFNRKFSEMEGTTPSAYRNQ